MGLPKKKRLLKSRRQKKRCLKKASLQTTLKLEPVEKTVPKKRIVTNQSQARARREQEAEALYEKLLGPNAGEGWSRDGMIGSD